MDNDELYNLDLHQNLLIVDSDFELFATRVPGGWIYTAMVGDSGSTCFIPFNSEFKVKS